MFERFTNDARQAVVLAQEEAVALHHGWIGTEHLLLGVLRADGDGARLLAGFGVDAAGVRDDVVRIVGRGEDDIDRDALATLGIDLDAVRERVERAFGPGALMPPPALPARRDSARPVPFTRARQEGARAHACARRSASASATCAPSTSSSGSLREGDGVAARILTERGVTHAAARERIAGRDAA